MYIIVSKTQKDKQPNILKDWRPGSWIHVEEPTEEEQKLLVDRFKLDAGHIKDALDLYEVPRLEKERGALYLFLRFPTKVDEEIATTPYLMIVQKDTVFTICEQRVAFLESFVTGLKKFSTQQQGKFVLQILNESMRRYTIAVTDINRMIRKNTEALRGGKQIRDQDIARFVLQEDALNDFLNALVPMRTVLTELLSGKHIPFHSEDIDLVEDISLHVGQIIENCQAQVKTISNIKDAYSTILNNRLNRFIKILTTLTVVLMIPTIIGGWYGMNVPLPFQDSPLAFFFIVGGSIIVSSAILLLFIRNKWL